MARGLKDDLPDGESELFFREGLDRGFANCPTANQRRALITRPGASGVHERKPP